MEIILDSGGNGGNGGTGGTGGGLLGLALMPAIWASSPRNSRSFSRRPSHQRSEAASYPKSHRILYLLRKNERDLKISKFEDLLGQIREVFSAFPGVLKQPTAHLSTLIPWGARKTRELG